MAGKGGNIPGSGRPKGTLNKKTQESQKLAESLGVDPLAILLHFAANHWKELGYESESETRVSAMGEVYTVQVIQPDMRISAAKEAVKYLRPQLKAIEHSGDMTVNQGFVIEKTYAPDVKTD